MADPENPSFETAGVNPGEADAWTTVTPGTSLVADFGEGGIPKPVEDFTGASWGTDPYAYLVTGGVGTLFDGSVAPAPSAVETFNRWFNNHNYRTTVTGAGGIAMQFDGATATVEDFLDASWGTAPYVTNVSGGSSFMETFQAPGWGVYVTNVTGGTLTSFDNASSSVEDFAPVSADLLFTVDPATDTCTTLAAHGKSNGFKVTVISTGAYPGGLAQNQVYYFINASGSSFKLSTTVGGSAVDITSLGTGSHYVHADETVYWTDVE